MKTKADLSELFIMLFTTLRDRTAMFQVACREEWQGKRFFYDCRNRNDYRGIDLLNTIRKW